MFFILLLLKRYNYVNRSIELLCFENVITYSNCFLYIFDHQEFNEQVPIWLYNLFIINTQIHVTDVTGDVNSLVYCQ